MYCVYLTVYGGDRLPPYYIGSTSLKRLRSGYCGSVSSKLYKTIWEEELVINRGLFNVYIISIHKTREEALIDELKCQIDNNILINDMFINRSYARVNGFFGVDVKGCKNPMFGKSRTGEKHKGGDNISKALKDLFDSDCGYELRYKRSLRMLGENNPMYGKVRDDGWKLKRSLDMIGEKNPMYGKFHTDEVKMKISLANKGRKSPNKGKVMSDEQKEKLRKPKSEEHKMKLRNTYYVDGIMVDNAKLFCEINGLSYICFVRAAKTNKPYKGMIITKSDEK